MNNKMLGNAVQLTNAYKQFGRSANANVVLDGLNMTVPQGIIYGLLGASGCGKTTLLSCIVGRRKLNSGDIWVLGGRPGTKESGIPGPRVGYMPQEIALVGELTIKDCADHFGWIHGLTAKQIDAKYSFLETLLDLPPRNIYVKNLSGGQQRRASLAIALIHDPELLILDEPTVGLDPVLRQNIWDYLVKLATEQNKTIIITTHYIEEARQAHVIGLMRNGKLLDEGSPSFLMSKYGCSTIEQVFLLLSEKQESKLQAIQQVDSNLNTDVPSEYNDIIRSETESMKPKELKTPKLDVNSKKTVSFDRNYKYPDAYRSSYFARSKALLSKNILRVVRHPGGLGFTFILPVLEIITFFMTVGGNPRNLRFGIVNQEMMNYSSCEQYSSSMPTGVIYTETDCTYEGLSCHFLTDFYNSLETKYIYDYFDDVESAKQAVRKGHAVGVIHFSENFTEAFRERLYTGKDTDDDTLDSYEIKIWLDMANRQTGYLIQQQMYEAYFNFSKQILEDCGENPKVAMIPIAFNEPVFGRLDSNYGTFIAPGVIVTLIFFLAVTVTSIVIITERDEGVWDRTLVAGVSTTEILVSHIMTQGLVMMLQTAEVMITCFGLFGLRCQGSFITVTLLLLMQGLCGMLTGFSISIFCDTVTSSNYVSMGSFVPIIVLSGSIWPLEGMPEKLQWLSLCLPTTLATQAMRNIIEKGLSFFDHQVIVGYAVSMLWIGILCVFSAILLRFKSS